MIRLNAWTVRYGSNPAFTTPPWKSPSIREIRGVSEIRPVHSQRNNKGRICNFLIHASAPPHFLEGCVAPGYESARGLEASSQSSLETIFLSLGGFEAGKPVLFNVSGVMPAN
ncbi:MAG: hypothetical protein H6976_10225 [Gammaproteobacteria bacterium]|nr:hypothetical protein [Gammaproteobacteria bacterium]